MKITILLPERPVRPSGGALVAYEYARRLSANHWVEVIHSRALPSWAGNGGPWQRKVRTNARRALERLVGRRDQWFDALEGIRVREFDCVRESDLPDADVLIATFWPTVEWAAQLPKRCGMVIGLNQGHEIWGGCPLRVEATWRFPIHRVCVSRWLTDYALSIRPDPSMSEHIPNAVDHDAFSVRSPIQGRRPSIAFSYGESDWKGAADAIAVVDAVRAEFPDVRVRSFGIWRRPAALPKGIEYLRLPTRAALAEALNETAVFLCTSWNEGWGLPGAEAMACGAALVSTDNGGVRDYATDGVNALLAAPRDRATLTEHTKRLLRDSALRYRLAHVGVETIRKFRWEESAKLLEARLESWIYGARRVAQ